MSPSTSTPPTSAPPASEPPASTGARSALLVGSLVGLVGGSMFVLSSSGQLTDAWQGPVRLGWALLTAPCVALLLAQLRRPAPPRRTPHPHATEIYFASLVGMLTALWAGADLLRLMGAYDAVPAWALVAMGAHLVPFAWAFRMPVFHLFGWGTVAIGLVGIGLGLRYPVSAGAGDADTGAGGILADAAFPGFPVLATLVGGFYLIAAIGGYVAYATNVTHSARR